MARKTNTFEGGVDATTISTVNSGGASGDAFSAISIGTGGACVFDTAAAWRGALGMLCKVTTIQTYVEWSGLASVDCYRRFAFKIASLPSAADRIVNYLTAGAVRISALDISSAGKLLLIGAASQAALATSVTTLVANTWYQAEFYTHQDAAAGVITAKLYDSSGTLLETLTVSGQALGSTAIDRVRFGQLTGSQPDIRFDEVGYDTAAWMNPVVLNTHPTGYAEALGLGSHRIKMTLVPAGLAEALALGNPAFSGLLGITPNGASSALGLGDPAIAAILNVAPDGYGGVVALGESRLRSTVYPDALDETIAVNIVRIGFRLVPTGFADAVQLGTPALSARLDVVPVGLAEAIEAGHPFIGFGGLVLSPDGLVEELALGAPVVLARVFLGGEFVGVIVASEEF